MIFTKSNNINRLFSPFVLFTISIFIITLLPSLIQDGMFCDGIQYAAISKNLANGLGSFWFPYLSENWDLHGSSYFLEHPPLVYAIQSVFFTILGDGMYTERIYCLFTAAISAFLIAQIWKLVTKNDPEIIKMSWLPVLFWIMTPIVFHSFQMDIQENTMGIFILASVYFSIRGINSSKYSYLNIFLAGVSIFLASLSKGIPGLFPIVTIGIYWLADKRIKLSRMLIYSIILSAVPVILYSLILLSDDAYSSLSYYINERLFERVQNDPITSNHIDILIKLLIDLLPVIIISVLIYFFGRKRISGDTSISYKKDVTIFLLIGIAGSAPLALTLVQRDFYLAPSIPFYAIGLALFSAPYLIVLLKRVFNKPSSLIILRSISIALILGGLIYSGMMIGRSERDHDVLNDMYLIGHEVGEETRVGLAADGGDHWSFELYLIRYFTVSLDYSPGEYDYLIRWKSEEVSFHDSYKLVPLDTRRYSLYKKN